MNHKMSNPSHAYDRIISVKKCLDLNELKTKFPEAKTALAHTCPTCNIYIKPFQQQPLAVTTMIKDGATNKCAWYELYKCEADNTLYYFRKDDLTIVKGITLNDIYKHMDNLNINILPLLKADVDTFSNSVRSHEFTALHLNGLRYIIRMSDKALKEIQKYNNSARESEVLKVEYLKFTGIDIDDEPDNGIIVQIVVPSEDTRSEQAAKTSERLRKRGSSSSSRQDKAFYNGDFGGLNGEEADIAKWNCD